MALTLGKRLHNPDGRLVTTVFVIGNCGGCDPKMLQQAGTVPGVFRRDKVYAAQYIDRPLPHITQVTDRCGDDIQPSFHVFPLYYRLAPQAVAGLPEFNRCSIA